MSKEFFPVFDEQKFGEDIGRILDKFQFSGELRRKIFSQIMEYATENARFEQEQATQRKAIKNDNNR
jgi:hypothetical protein